MSEVDPIGAGRAGAGAGAPPARSFAAALAALRPIEQARARLAAALAAARAPGPLEGARLLALQAEACRLGQAVDLGARAVEQASQALRQALQSQP